MKSFARIHVANLINSGILPLTFKNPDDYENIDPEDEIEIKDAISQVKAGGDIVIRNVTKSMDIVTETCLSDRQIDMMLAGGLLNYTRENNK